MDRVSPCIDDEVQENDRLRRFLLMPSRPDFHEPERLRQISAMWIGILCVPPEKRQNFMIALLELMALVSGLMLPLPIMLLRPQSAASLSGSSWSALPLYEDWMDALAVRV